MASLYSLEQALDYRSLTTVYREGGREIAGVNPLWNYYCGGEPTEVRTDRVEFLNMGRTKDPSPLNVRGAPARTIQPTGAGRREMVLARIHNVISLEHTSLMMLRHPEQWSLQDRGMDEIRRQLVEFGSRAWLTKYVMLAKALVDGVVHLDGNMDILESSVGSAMQIQFGVPPQNQGLVAKSAFGMGAGNIVDLPWSDPNAKILTQLDSLNEAAERQNGEPLRHVWINRLGKRWIRENNEIKSFFAAGRERLDQATSAGEFEINNYVFHFYGGSYQAADGATRPYLPETRAIVTPERGPWFLHAAGLELIPKTTGVVGAQVDEVLKRLDEAFGDFSYVNVAVTGGLEVQLFAGSNFMVGFKNPRSVFQLSVA